MLSRKIVLKSQGLHHNAAIIIAFAASIIANIAIIAIAIAIDFIFICAIIFHYYYYHCYCC